MSTTADQELAELRRAYAELQRAYTELRNERDAALTELQARSAALAQRNSEYGERIEQQAATVDVLKAMSASPGDAQPVFRLIVERALAFCEADGASLALLNDDMLHLQAYAGFFHRDYEADFPRLVNSTTMFGRAVRACDVVQMPDVAVDPDHYTKGLAPQRAIIAVPLLRAGMPIGAIAIGRSRPGEFSSAEVELLRTFAAQAVIAISSAATYRALQTRTSDLQEALEQQTATAEVLQAINASPGDLAPVFEEMLERAVRLCGATYGHFRTFDGEGFPLAAVRGDPNQTQFHRSRFRYFQPGPHNPISSFIRGEHLIHIADAAEDEDYRNERFTPALT